MKTINLNDLVGYLEKNGIEVEVEKNPSKERLNQISKSIDYRKRLVTKFQSEFIKKIIKSKSEKSGKTVTSKNWWKRIK
jgi:hypothetical protein